MKKVFCVGFMLVGLFMLSGCNSKVLECSKDSSYNEEMKMIQNLKVTFKGDTINKLSMDMNVELGDTYLEYRDSLIESVESEFISMNDSDNIKYSTSKKDNGFNFEMTADIKNMDDSTKDKLEIINTGSSYEAAKAEFEKDGYICK